MTKFLLGLGVGVGISYLAYRARTLSRSGTLAAAALGTVVFGLGGPGWAVVLLTFFTTASVLSKIFKKPKMAAELQFAKGSRRDASQVAANGAVAGVMALMYFILTQAQPESNWLSFLWIGFASSLAGANADTWATELGILNPRQPRLVTSFRQVPKGTSGAISLIGTLAAFNGAAVVGGMAALMSLAGWAPVSILPLGLQFSVIALAGLVGAMVDSWLGATLQAVYFCPKCEKETERHPLHGCGAETALLRGLGWLSNDWVNFTCTLSAGLVGVLLVVIVNS